MLSKIPVVTALAIAGSSLVSAQTFSSCNPVKGDKCPDDPALGKSITIDFTKGKSDLFTLADGTTLDYTTDKGALFSIKKEGNAPTITSDFYIFFGKVEVVVQASKGQGVVTSSVFQSDCLDEVDWEFLGGDTAQVQSNYFRLGDVTTYDRGAYHKIDNPQSSFHTYTVEWTKDQVVWSIDGAPVRTLSAAALNGKFPQTPMQIKLGTWVAGGKDAPKGTVEWAGGYTDFSQAPFDGYYKSVTISDYCGGSSECKTGATSYAYADNSGTWQQITIKTDGKPVEGGKNDQTTSITSASATATTLVPSPTKVDNDTSKPTNGQGIGFVGNGPSNSTTTSGSGSSPTQGGNPAGASKPPTTPNSGVKGAASLLAVAGGLLAAFLAL